VMEQGTVYLPPTPDRPAEPAPWVLTEDDVIRLARMDSVDPYSALRRYRQKGWLKATQLGNHVRFLLPDVLAFFEKAKEENPR
jgi:hypothetical protein